MTATPILLSDNSSGVEAAAAAAAVAVDAASPSPSFQFYAQVRKCDMCLRHVLRCVNLWVYNLNFARKSR